MPLPHLVSLEVKTMLRRREFMIALSFAMAVSIGTFLMDLIPLFHTGAAGHFPAWYLWSPVDLSLTPSHLVWDAFYIFALPFVAALACSDCYFEANKTGILKSILARCDRSRYLVACAVTVFLGGFIVIFLPLLINQLLWLIAAPVNTLQSVASMPFRDLELIDYQLFPKIFVREPYLNNFIFSVVPAVTGALLALLSFSISLFFKKKKFVVLTLPGIAYLGSCFAFDLLGMTYLDMSNYMSPVSMISGMRPGILAAFLTLLLIINLIALAYKILFIKDEF